MCVLIRMYLYMCGKRIALDLALSLAKGVVRTKVIARKLDLVHGFLTSSYTARTSSKYKLHLLG